MARCVFCEGLAGRVELAVVAEDEATVAFLDHRPVFPGHVLLVPRRHVTTLDRLHDGEVGPLFRRLRLLARAVPLALGAQGTFVANNNVVSQSVPHLHWHVVPRVKKDGLKGFFWPRHPYESAEHMRSTQLCLQRAVEQEEVLECLVPEAEGEGGRFEPSHLDTLLQRCLGGGLEEWSTSCRGRLAVLALLDRAGSRGAPRSRQAELFATADETWWDQLEPHQKAWAERLWSRSSSS